MFAPFFALKGHDMTTADVTEAKRSVATNILDDLAAELDKGFVEDTFEVAGHTWTMRTLQDHERAWASGFIRTQSMNSMLSSMRAPTLAAGIRSVDGKPVAEFFKDAWEKEATDMGEAVRKVMESQNPYILQYWFAEQLYVWLSKRPPSFVEKLWEKWLLLEKRREEAEVAMGKSSSPAGS